MLGHATLPQGLERTLALMRTGQTAFVYMNQAEYGYSPSRRPRQIAPDDRLYIRVTVLRVEKEPNLSELNTEQKFAFCSSRREIGKFLYGNKQYNSACVQYEKGISALESILDPASPQAKQHAAQSGQSLAAIEPLSEDQAQQKKQLHAMMLINQSQCMFQALNYPLCIELCNKALTVDPTSLKALYRRADAYRLSDELTEAQRDYASVLQHAACDDTMRKSVDKSIADCKRREVVLSKAAKAQFDGFLQQKGAPAQTPPANGRTAAPPSAGEREAMTTVDAITGDEIPVNEQVTIQAVTAAVLADAAKEEAAQQASIARGSVSQRRFSANSHLDDEAETVALKSFACFQPPKPMLQRWKESLQQIPNAFTQCKRRVIAQAHAIQKAKDAKATLAAQQQQAKNK